MRVLILDAPQAMLDERRRLGLDGRDEMWDGVVHMVPPPPDAPGGLSGDFFVVAAPIAKALGLVPRMETGLFATAKNFRVPDQLYRRPEQGSDRGAEGAELVVEVRSARDETYDKLPFYAERGVREVLVLHPEPRAVELFRLGLAGLVAVAPGEDGAVHCEVLGLTLAPAPGGGALRLTWAGGSAEV
ncbi:MAG: Uma2 family endonuclease [Sporichthyaceae bacterium]